MQEKLVVILMRNHHLSNFKQHLGQTGCEILNNLKQFENVFSFFSFSQALQYVDGVVTGGEIVGEVPQDAPLRHRQSG